MISKQVVRVASLCLLLTTIGVSTYKTYSQARSPEVDNLLALLNQHDDALNQKNIDTLMGLYADGPNTVMMGTGPGERWEGKDEIRAAYGQIVKDFDTGSLSHSCYWKDGGVNGNMAWLASMCKMSDTSNKKKRDYELNVSAVFEKLNDKWFVRAMHYSNVVSGKKP